MESEHRHVKPPAEMVQSDKLFVKKQHSRQGTFDQKKLKIRPYAGYIINSISEYLGNGQISSGISASSWSDGTRKSSSRSNT